VENPNAFPQEKKAACVIQEHQYLAIKAARVPSFSSDTRSAIKLSGYPSKF
jgi:hypothetical protein